MHSRLYTRVLNQHAWMHNCTSFNSLYNETGIVGIFATAESAHAEEAVDVLTKEMQVRPLHVCVGFLAACGHACTSLSTLAFVPGMCWVPLTL